jgi:hypothetical protein
LVELNQYQTLPHLNLKLKQGNDEAIKKHLATKLKETKESNERLNKNVATLDDAYKTSA